jgi:DNA-binding transcriptional MerR regulator/mannose-6-phosphate isomerase-like protein (cupin superfamily)
LTDARKRSRGPRRSPGYLRIGDVARLVGVSASILRSWETLGLISPARTQSQYRLYTQADVRLLKRAQFLRRARGMNAPAIVHMLKTQGLLSKSGASQPQTSSIGPRLRRLRLRRGYSLARVSQSVGVSIGFLSALERGQMSASIATLRRLARFYRLSILSLFDPSEANPGRVRPEQRKVLEGNGVRMELLSWGNTVMEPHLFRIAPAAGSGDESYTHEGEEFLYILKGCIEIALNGGEANRLEEGDSFYFESSTPHRWVNPGKKEAWVLWVNTPPTF